MYTNTLNKHLHIPLFVSLSVCLSPYLFLSLSLSLFSPYAVSRMAVIYNISLCVLLNNLWGLLRLPILSLFMMILVKTHTSVRDCIAKFSLSSSSRVRESASNLCSRSFRHLSQYAETKEFGN